MRDKPMQVTAIWEGEERTMNCNQWSLICGIAAGTIHHRLRGGMDPTAAITLLPKFTMRRHKVRDDPPGNRNRMKAEIRNFLYPPLKQGLTRTSECGIMGVRTSEVKLI